VCEPELLVRRWQTVLWLSHILFSTICVRRQGHFTGLGHHAPAYRYAGALRATTGVYRASRRDAEEYIFRVTLKMSYGWRDMYAIAIMPWML
jgi:hypothetical protein